MSDDGRNIGTPPPGPHLRRLQDAAREVMTGSLVDRIEAAEELREAAAHMTALADAYVAADIDAIGQHARPVMAFAVKLAAIQRRGDVIIRAARTLDAELS